MNLAEMKKKALALIEEYDPSEEQKTNDADIGAKLNDVINQIMFELARIKRIPKYVEMTVKQGDVITLADISKECGSEVYQLAAFCGVSFVPKADGTVLKILEDGVAEIDVYAYPERITEKTKDNAYEFELSDDVLEIMPYGIAADLLKSDRSAEYGTIYAQRYESLKQQLDIRYQGTMISFEGGVSI